MMHLTPNFYLQIMSHYYENMSIARKKILKYDHNSHYTYMLAPKSSEENMLQDQNSA